MHLRQMLIQPHCRTQALPAERSHRQLFSPEARQHSSNRVPMFRRHQETGRRKGTVEMMPGFQGRA